MQFRSVVGFAVGPFLTAAIGMATVPLMTWVFPPQDVARFALFQTTISVALLALGLGLDQVFVREFNQTPDRAALLKTSMLPTLALITLLALLVIPNANSLAYMLYGVSDPILTYFTLGTVALLYVNRMGALLVRMNLRGLVYTVAELLTRLIQMALVIVAAYHPALREVVFLLAGCVAAFAVANVFLLVAERHTWHSVWSAPVLVKQIPEFLRYGLPLVISGVAFWALTAAGIFFLRKYSTLSELAVYSVTISISNAAVLVQTAFVLIWTPIVYQWMAQGLDVKRLERVAHGAAAIIGLIFCFAGLISHVIDWLLPAHYSAVSRLVLCGLVLPLLYTLSEVTYVGIAVLRRTLLAVWASLAALLASVVLNNFLVPSHGATGAAIASAVGGLVFFVGRTELSARVWQPLRRARLYALTTAMTVVGTLGALGMPFVNVFTWLVLALLIVVSFRRDLITMIQNTKDLLATRRARATVL